MASALLLVSLVYPVAAITAETQDAVSQSRDAELETLRQQLDAQRAINDQLHKRVQQLETQLDPVGRAAILDENALNKSAASPPVDQETEATKTALGQSLISQGLVLLPAGVVRVTPRFGWSQVGNNSGTYDAYSMSLGAEVGLPWAMSASLTVPYLHTTHTAYGDTDGLGNVDFSLAKRFNAESDRMPSFIGRLGYSQRVSPSDSQAAFGRGFNAYSASLSAVKTMEPVAVYGSLGYQTYPSTHQTIQRGGLAGFDGNISPGDIYSVAAGMSLAATPSVSLNAGLYVSHNRPSHLQQTDGPSYTLPSQTAGYLLFGSGFLLRKNLFLAVSVGAGVTDHASDVVISVALPYTF
jgi:hypothetical protein